MDKKYVRILVLIFIFVSLSILYLFNNRNAIAVKFIKSGISLNSNAMYNSSIVSYRAALIFNPKSAWAYNALGTSYYNKAKYSDFSKRKIQKDYEKSVKYFDKAIELANGYYPSAYVNRGNAYERLGKYKLALNDYNAALKYEPHNYDALYGLVMVYSSRDYKQYQKSIDILNTLIKTNPRSANLYFSMGWNYDKLGLGKKSIENYLKVVEINPKRVDAWINLSYVSEITLSDYEAAVKYADKALDLNPNSMYALSNKAYALVKLKRYEEAMEYINIELYKSPDYSRAYFQRGQVKLAKGDKQGARQDFLKAIELEEQYDFDDKDKIVSMIKDLLKKCK